MRALLPELPLIRRYAPPSPQGVKAFVPGQVSKVDSYAKKKKAMENFHRFAGASCLTRTGDTLINSQVL